MTATTATTATTAASAATTPDDEDRTTDGLCFDCGSPAPFIIFVAGEDEKMHEEYACERHARGHRRAAVVTAPSTVEVAIYAW
ncbi:MAG: hypothetical protein KIT84_41130 [Labilithrix sp.]|nr:hypothetical protein [Labilithrix sp.]MCW5817475.1 hypothetical protein [Labilithrix sp.]